MTTSIFKNGLLFICFFFVPLFPQGVAPPTIVGLDTIRVLSAKPIQTNLIQVFGDSIRAIFVNPKLPRGIAFNDEGVLSGTPTLISPLTKYYVLATNPAGQARHDFFLEVYTDEDSPLPHIDSVTTPLAEGIYKKGTRVMVTIHFSQIMTLDKDGAITSLSTDGNSISLVSTSIKNKKENTVSFDYQGNFTATALNVGKFELSNENALFTDPFGRVMENLELPEGKNLADYARISLVPDDNVKNADNPFGEKMPIYSLELNGKIITTHDIIQEWFLYSISGNLLENVKIAKPYFGNIAVPYSDPSLSTGNYLLRLKHANGFSNMKIHLSNGH